MTDQPRDEKEEEKRDEKEEKSWEEKWRRDPLSAIAWACIFIWAGLVFLADNLGYLARFEPLHAWSFIFIGAGAFVFLEAIARLLMPAYRRGITGSLIFAVILIAIGLQSLGGWSVIWPLVLIVIGVAMLLRGFIWRG
ncbi:MAG: hypothetical protein H5T64_12400 [Chloroflexi bacterium]|nr:hypothetical protein [Chloroflexota bacterium]